MSVGRKRSFNEQEALESAMRVFWQKGYVGASLSDLTDSMGINKPSMYAAFGNKEELFVEATKHYTKTRALIHNEHLLATERSLQERLVRYLSSVIAGQCQSDMPKGCYIALCSAEAAGDELPTKARQVVEEAGRGAIDCLTHLFETDLEAKTLGLDQVAEEKALFLVSIMHGTASMARAGVSREKLETVIANALSGWVERTSDDMVQSHANY